MSRASAPSHPGLAAILGFLAVAFFILSVVLMLLREIAASLLSGLFGLVLLSAAVNMAGGVGGGEGA